MAGVHQNAGQNQSVKNTANQSGAVANILANRLLSGHSGLSPVHDHTRTGKLAPCLSRQFSWGQIYEIYKADLKS